MTNSNVEPSPVNGQATDQQPLSPVAPSEPIGKPVTSKYDNDKKAIETQNSDEEIQKELNAINQTVPVVNGDEDQKPPMLSDKVYDILKEIALTWIPALAIGYAFIAHIWNLPYGYEVVVTAAVVDFVLAIILHISAKSFQKSMAMFDGIIGLHGSAQEPIATAKIFDGTDMMGKSSVNLKVVDNTH